MLLFVYNFLAFFGSNCHKSLAWSKGGIIKECYFQLSTVLTVFPAPEAYNEQETILGNSFYKPLASVGPSCGDYNA